MLIYRFFRESQHLYYRTFLRLFYLKNVCQSAEIMLIYPEYGFALGSAGLESND